MSERAEQVSQSHADHLMRKKNVVGVAGGEDEVVVFVTRKEPLSALDEADVVDPELEELETDVIEVGEITPMLGSGDSIGQEGAGTGTLGGVVEDENGFRYVLTNNHVAARSNDSRVLAPLYHPGPADGLGQRFGVLARFEPIYFDRPNLFDAALVRLDSDYLGVLNRYEPDTTTGRTGWMVQKFGRTTHLTEGKVIGRNATVDVNFGSKGTARFTDQLVTTHMLEPGDSGSVLLSRSRHPIGLSFAGSDTISLHSPINLVLRTLSVSFVDSTTS